MRLVYVRASKGQVLDTWYSTGLRGSGSHDVELKDVFIPETHTIDFPNFRSQRPGPLWAFPLLFLYMFPGVALGVARAAIDAFIDIANRREITIAALGGQRALLRTSASVQSTVARAEGLVRSSRSHVFDVMNEIWTKLSRGEPLAPIVRANYAICRYQRASQLYGGRRPAFQSQWWLVRIFARATRSVLPRHPYH